MGTSKTAYSGPKLTMAERKQQLDDWMGKANERIGEWHYPYKGLATPDKRVAYHGAWNNEWVTPDLIRHYADALGDANPLWRSEEYAERTRWGGIIAPPTFTDVISISAIVDLRNLPPNVDPLIAGADRRWFRVMRPGDRIKVRDVYRGVKELPVKDKPYRLFTETYQRVYFTHEGETVAEVDSPTILIAPYEVGEAGGGAMQDREFHRYSDEDIAEFREKMKQNKCRGRETLFWEDINVGDELPELVPGPLDATDVWVFFGSIGYQASFDLRWNIMDDDPSFCIKDPETNLMQMGDLIHILPSHARERVNTIPFGTAVQSEGLLCRMICNWMGDDGFLKRLKTKARRPNYLSDLSTMRGKVVRKYEEDGEYLVDLDVSCTNQLGVVHMPGEATVSLVSRQGQA